MRTHLPTSLGAIACGFVALTALAGCGGSGAALHGVSGKISLDGEAIAQGSITFVPAADTQGPSGGSNIENGTYQVPREKGLVAGNYRVEIRAQRPTGRQIPAQSPAPPGTMIPETKEAVPANFNTASELQVEIPSPKNTLDFQLTTP